MPVDPSNLTSQHLSDDPDKMILSHKRVSSLASLIRELKDENGDLYSMPELIHAVGVIVYLLGREDGI
jgi:hypothetical protein